MQLTEHVDLETLGNIISTIPSCIFFKDTELKYVFSSHYWEQVNAEGDEDFDIYGKTDREIRKDKQNVDNVEKADRAIMETGIGTQYTIKSEVDGHVQYLNLVKEPVRDSNGNIIGIVGLINDITVAMDEVTVKLKEAVEETERVANMKSDFLANMSHEIRTPMNAIIGMAEMVLRENISKEARDYINQIKSSGNALLNIINDILDFSKIESGKMDIIEEEYEPLSVMHDLSSILMTRLQDKDVELVGGINPDLPIGLCGDVLRIRQIVINIANNAIKFTNHGYVLINIGFEKVDEDTALIHILVKDTGIGIKKEDIGKLFNSFQQVDAKRNRNIEGTGLGLAITSRLLDLMGGSIRVESEYGEGSEFTITIPQKVTNWAPSITINDASQKAVIGYWKGQRGSRYFYDTLKRLKVDSYALIDVDKYEKLSDMYADNLKGKDVYLFTSYETYEQEMTEFVDNHPEINFVLTCDFFSKVTLDKPNIRILKKPFSTLGVATALNNEDVLQLNYKTVEFDFIAPDARVMIVDDNEVNLIVAEGLLEPLKMNITKALSGKEALKNLETQSYDIVFMDHMMPELDGVETTRIIRRLHPELENMPIITLTANAVGEAKKMFLAEGMNDFVAKPIEVRTIISKIKQWLPKDKIKKSILENSDKADITNEEKKEEQNQKLEIADFDIDAALALIGNEKLYMTILEKYYRVMKAKAEAISLSEKTEDISTYTIEVHALKSSSKQIGAMELSEMAAELEKCGNAKNIDAIHSKTAALLEKYLSYHDILKALFDKEEDVTSDSKPAASLAELSPLFDKMLEAVDNLDMDCMEETVGEMNNYSYADEFKELMEELKEAVSNIDVDEIERIITEWRAKG